MEGVLLITDKKLFLTTVEGVFYKCRNRGRKLREEALSVRYCFGILIWNEINLH